MKVLKTEEAYSVLNEATGEIMLVSRPDLFRLREEIARELLSPEIRDRAKAILCSAKSDSVYVAKSLLMGEGLNASDALTLVKSLQPEIPATPIKMRKKGEWGTRISKKQDVRLQVWRMDTLTGKPLVDFTICGKGKTILPKLAKDELRRKGFPSVACGYQLVVTQGDTKLVSSVKL